MATIEMACLDDRVIFSGSEVIRPGVYAIDDKSFSREVKYSDFDRLEMEPLRTGPGKPERREFFVPAVGRTVVFLVDSQQEQSMGPNEETISGPYIPPVKV